MVRVSFWRFLSLAAVLLLLSVLVLSAYGDEIQNSELGYIETEPTEQAAEIWLDTSEDIRQTADGRSVVIVQPPVRDIAPVTPSDSSGLKAILLSLFGNYDPVVIEYTYTNSQGYVSYVREIEPDYAWMITAGIFAIVLYSFFRIVGVFFKKWMICNPLLPGFLLNFPVFLCLRLSR